MEDVTICWWEAKQSRKVHCWWEVKQSRKIQSVGGKLNNGGRYNLLVGSEAIEEDTICRWEVKQWRKIQSVGGR